MSLDLKSKTYLTFDVYGTLIDWETGIIQSYQPILKAHQIVMDDERLLERFAFHEAEVEAGPYKRYSEVLSTVLQRLGQELGFTAIQEELLKVSRSVEHWPAFSDSARALAQLAKHFKLVVMSNVDDELFAFSNKKLGVEFDTVITAQQVGSYKPNLEHFHEALKRLGDKEQILHVAQSLFHDHVPAKQMGWDSVWINRRAGKSGAGATPPASAKPDLEFPDLQSFADFISSSN
jgi:2-haloacid dehalogenase